MQRLMASRMIGRLSAVLGAFIVACSAQARMAADTLYLDEQRLFFVNACDCDEQFLNRPTPCFAVIEDSTIVFSTYVDTLAFYDLGGVVIRKVHHRLGYPSYMYYNDDRNLLYFLNTGIRGEIKRTNIYTMDTNGALLDSVRFSGDFRQWWVHTGAVSNAEFSTISSLLKINKMGGRRYSVSVPAVSDIQTVLGEYVFLGRRLYENKHRVISKTTRSIRPFKLIYIDPLPDDRTCEIPNDIKSSVYNMRWGYCASSMKDKLFYVWQTYTGFCFSLYHMRQGDPTPP